MKKLIISLAVAFLATSGIAASCGKKDDTTEKKCSGHGTLVSGECDCDSGYKQDPADATACIVDNGGGDAFEFISVADYGFYGTEESGDAIWEYDGLDSEDQETANVLSIQNWQSYGGPTSTGTYSISSTEADMATCGFCLVYARTADEKIFMPKAGEGSYTFTTLGAAVGETFAGSISGLVLQEVTIDSSTYETTPVSGGETLEFNSFDWSVTMEAMQ